MHRREIINRVKNNLYNKLKSKDSNSQRTNYLIKIGQMISKEIKMSVRDMKKCPASLTIREIKIKTTVRSHLAPVRMGITEKAGDVEEKRAFTHCGDVGGAVTMETV